MNGKVTISAEELEPLLRVSLKSDDTVRRRAQVLATDIHQISFAEFTTSVGAYPFQRGSVADHIAIPEYHFGDTGCSIDNAENAEENKIEWFGGIGLDRGHLQFFSHVSEIGHALIPQYWLSSKKLRNALRNPSQHLDTIEEVAWLSMWKDVRDFKMGERLIECSEVDVDWSFLLLKTPFKIHLEVKRVRSDAIRHSRERSFNREWFTRFCENKVLPKFRPSAVDEINVLALSLFGEIDRNVQIVVSDWLQQHRNLMDAVIVVSREARRRSSYDLQIVNEKARILKAHFTGPDSEDAQLIFVHEVPLKIPGFPTGLSGGRPRSRN